MSRLLERLAALMGRPSPEHEAEVRQTLVELDARGADVHRAAEAALREAGRALPAKRRARLDLELRTIRHA